jgi:MSHA pilin protein MshD
MRMNPERRRRGFTLIETVFVLVVLALGVTAFLNLIRTTTAHSADPMIQQQAHAIAQAYMEEILARPFCDPDTVPSDCPANCTSAACGSCNTVEGSRSLYDSVCDYDGLGDTTGARDFSGSVQTGLEDYNVDVTVDDDAVTLGGLDSGSGEVVEVEVQVTHDEVDALNTSLKAYKANF